MSQKCAGRWFPRWAVWTFLWVWLAMTLPMVTVLALNEYSRFPLMQTCAHWRNKVFGLDSVFIGDSITAGGRNWGWRLDSGLLSSRNPAGSGSTVRHYKPKRWRRSNIEPSRMFVMAGTYDILEGRDVGASMRDYAALLKSLSTTPGPSGVVVTLVPQTAV